ncbi:hypothetical protein QM012_004200 [Aureobasidium pullulans]|uniref:C2H2-type domain-containing protein n=1 Tax=Aureobasidium pullulans TaxID=5580 RepID=A0ABR0TU57_AURPU
MDHSAYYSSTSPETKMEHILEADLYTTPGCTDGMFLSGAAPFSPVMSESNQSAYTLPASDVSFPSLDPSFSHEMPVMDTCRPDSWVPEQPGYNVFAEPTVFDTEMFAFPAQGMDIPQATFSTWYATTEASTYLAMDIPGQDLTRMNPQTAGFVGNPTPMVPHTGYSNPNLRAGHARIDSLYTQACPQDVAVSHNHIPSDIQTREIAGHRRMTVPVTFDEPVPALPMSNVELDLPYGAPIQQYRTHMPGYPSGSVMPFPAEVPVLGSNVSESSVGSVAPSAYGDVPCSPASSTATTRTRIEDTDGRARTDPLYSAKASKDGSYHCPFLASEGCQHKATKLKCNYDKYIDSHIKPFRCKHQNCNNNRFSSTACLLRHEREAHGLHGHGNKPFLCQFKDCDRSSSENGFPRAYNLLDHMKRVHGYRPDKVTKTPPASSAGRAAGKSQDKVKKRKTAGEAKKETASPRLVQKLAVDSRKQQASAQWQNQVNEMQRRYRQSG